MVHVNVHCRFKNINNAEKKGRHQALIRPCSNVIIMNLKSSKIMGWGDCCEPHREANPVWSEQPQVCCVIQRSEKWQNNLLPSHQFGFTVLTTSAGIMDHEEDKNTQEGKSLYSFSRDVIHTNKMPLEWGGRLKNLKKKKVDYINMYENESHLVVAILCDPMDYTVHGILQARILE